MKYAVRKSTTIDAPADKVRALVEDFNHWKSWSPWNVVEPGCPIDVTGTANQPGHAMSWDGEVIGSGKNTLNVSNAEGLYYDLEFFKPWKSKAKVSLVFEETGGQTNVTWSMDSSMPFFLFFMVKTMKNWIGMDYERGLRMLKEMAEQGVINCKTSNNGVVDYQGFSYRGIKRTVAFAEMPATMEKDFEQLVNDIVVNGKKSAEHWICVYPKFNMRTMMVTYIAAVSDENLADLQLGSGYVKGRIEGSKMLEIKHDGAYDFLGNAWSMGMMTRQAKKMKGKGFPFEQYWNSPMEVAPDDLKSSVYFPVK